MTAGLRLKNGHFHGIILLISDAFFQIITPAVPSLILYEVIYVSFLSNDEQIK
jgi:hypothetical protein